MTSLPHTPQRLSNSGVLFGLLAIIVLVSFVITPAEIGKTYGSPSRPTASPSPTILSDTEDGSQRLDDALIELKAIREELNEKNNEEKIREKKQLESAEELEARRKRETKIVDAFVLLLALILGLLVFFTVRKAPGEHNTSTLELFKFNKFRASRKHLKRRRLAADWLSQRHSVLYLIRIIGGHPLVFVVVLMGLYFIFTWTTLDVAILSCIEIFFAFVGAFYASLADRSSSLAYESATLAMRSVMNFSDDLGGFVERLKLLITRLTTEGKDITMKFVTVIPAFGKVGLSLPEGESYYSRMESQPRATSEPYEPWHDFLEGILRHSGKNGQGRIKVKMLTHGKQEREKWISSIIIASGLAESASGPVINTEIKFQESRLKALEQFTDSFKWQEWKTPPKGDAIIGNGPEAGSGHTINNSMPFQFVVIKMGIESEEAPQSRIKHVPLAKPVKAILAFLISLGVLSGIKKALTAKDGRNHKTEVPLKPFKRTQKPYDGSRLMFLFSGDYIYNNFLADIDRYNKSQSNPERIDLSMHEFVKFSKGYYSESVELIEFFDKLFDFLWKYSKTQQGAS